MKPPICRLCERSIDSIASPERKGGDLVKFADYPPLPDGMAGHPRGLEWFCVEHLHAAQALSSRSTGEAMAELLGVFGKSGQVR
jgi:hypothetical protein